jgi:chromosome segregation ATPase
MADDRNTNINCDCPIDLHSYKLQELKEKQEEHSIKINSVENSITKAGMETSSLFTIMDKYNEVIVEFVNGQDNVKERITLLESSTKSLHKRLDETNGQTETIIKMSMQIDNLTKEMEKVTLFVKEQDLKNITMFKNIDEKIDINKEEQDDKINLIYNKPANLALKSYIFIFTAIASTVIGVLISKFF